MNKQSEHTNILLAALGTTPQIITESLYHLMVVKKIFIHKIHLITTTEGRKKAENLLFQNGAGPFFQFCQEYGFSSTDLPSRYHLIENSQGEKLSDIRTPEDNQAAADYFLKVGRELTAREDVRIFATIAGGRKTMSAYLYLTMQLLGRDQDTLYHVLVRPESIESNPAFYYPHKDVEEMEFRDKQGKPFRVPVKDIRIDMAEIPFVRLRRILQKGIVDGVSHFAELVAMTQNSIDQAVFAPEVIVDLPEKLLRVTHQALEFRVTLRPVEIVFYAFLQKARRFRNVKPADPAAQHKMFQMHQREYRTLSASKHSFDFDSLQQALSKINRKIRTQIKHPAIREYLIIQSDHSRTGGPTYSLNTPLEKIRIIDSNTSPKA